MAVYVLDTNKLIELLEGSDVTVYRLAKSMEAGGVAQASVYSLVKGKHQPSLETLGVLVSALRETTGKTVEAGDLLKLVDGTMPPYLSDLPIMPQDEGKTSKQRRQEREDRARRK